MKSHKARRIFRLAYFALHPISDIRPCPTMYQHFISFFLFGACEDGAGAPAAKASGAVRVSGWARTGAASPGAQLGGPQVRASQPGTPCLVRCRSQVTVRGVAPPQLRTHPPISRPSGRCQLLLAFRVGSSNTCDRGMCVHVHGYVFLLPLGAQVDVALLGQRPAPGAVPGGRLPELLTSRPLPRGTGGPRSSRPLQHDAMPAVRGDGKS